MEHEFTAVSGAFDDEARIIDWITILLRELEEVQRKRVIAYLNDRYVNDA